VPAVGWSEAALRSRYPGAWSDQRLVRLELKKAGLEDSVFGLDRARVWEEMEREVRKNDRLEFDGASGAHP